jgi:hypothetical protein
MNNNPKGVNQYTGARKSHPAASLGSLPKYRASSGKGISSLGEMLRVAKTLVKAKGRMQPLPKAATVKQEDLHRALSARKLNRRLNKQK